MKKLIFIIIVAAIALASCDKTCTICKFNYNDPNIPPLVEPKFCGSGTEWDAYVKAKYTDQQATGHWTCETQD